MTQTEAVAPPEPVDWALAERTAALERSNAELEQFALAAGHDLRAPLTVISGCLEVAMLRAKGLLDLHKCLPL